MTLSLFVLAAVCVVNAPRARAVLPDEPLGRPPGSGSRPPPTRLAVAAIGAGLVLAVVVPLAALAEPLLDLVDIAAATARIATGLLLAVTGILLIGWPMPTPEPALAGRGAALVPMAFPTLLTPGLALLTLSGSADHSALVASVVLVVALATVPAMAAVPVRPPGSTQRRVVDAGARALAGVLILAGFGLLFDGVFDV